MGVGNACFCMDCTLLLELHVVRIRRRLQLLCADVESRLKNQL